MAALAVLPLAACALGPRPGAATSTAAVPVAPAAAGRQPAPTEPTCGRAADLQAQALQAINAARAVARRCGAKAAPAAGPLTWNPLLARAAAAHAADLARHDYFEHAGRDGRNVGDRVRAAGYAWRAVGENLALGQPDLAAVLRGWLGSPGHCENLMNPAFREVGLACVPNGQGRPLWTLNLGARLELPR